MKQGFLFFSDLSLQFQAENGMAGSIIDLFVIPCWRYSFRRHPLANQVISFRQQIAGGFSGLVYIHIVSGSKRAIGWVNAVLGSWKFTDLLEYCNIHCHKIGDVGSDEKCSCNPGAGHFGTLFNNEKDRKRNTLYI